jgi:hypothetical protein
MIATTVLVLILTIILIGGFTRAGAWDRNYVPDVAMGLLGWFFVNAIALMLFRHRRLTFSSLQKFLILSSSDTCNKMRGITSSNILQFEMPHPSVDPECPVR